MMNEGLELLQSFIRKCIFIHDDTHAQLNEGDWDQYSTNPFLLGANTCVVDTLEGFGDLYINYLKELNSYPNNIIIPARKSPFLVKNLLNDENALGALKRIIQAKELDISSFYSDSNKNFDKLIASVSSNSYAPTLYPSVPSFEIAYDKVEMRRRMNKAGLRMPLGEICNSINDIKLFFTLKRLKHSKILIKETHLKSFLIQKETDIDEIETKFKFPVVAEVVYDTISQPVSHYIVWENKIEHLFTLNQLVENWLHQGNSTQLQLSANERSTIIETSKEIINLIPNFSGVFGIDFIKTIDGEVFPIDINGRFNSSTYPYFFLLRKGIDLEKIYARSVVVELPVNNLSAIYTNPYFIPFNPSKVSGIFLFNPVFDFDLNKVRKFTYLVVDKTWAGLKELENAFLLILGSLRSSG